VVSQSTSPRRRRRSTETLSSVPEISVPPDCSEIARMTVPQRDHPRARGHSLRSLGLLLGWLPRLVDVGTRRSVYRGRSSLTRHLWSPLRRPRISGLVALVKVGHSEASSASVPRVGTPVSTGEAALLATPANSPRLTRRSDMGSERSEAADVTLP